MMTDSEKLNELRNLVGGEEEDTTLLTYLSMAKRKILNRMYPYAEDYTELELPVRYEGLQLEIAVYMMNKRGAEGEVQHNENGINRIYGTADVPSAMLAEVTPFCAIPG